MNIARASDPDVGLPAGTGTSHPEHGGLLPVANGEPRAATAPWRRASSSPHDDDDPTGSYAPTRIPKLSTSTW
jgi:hypothetical protein